MSNDNQNYEYVRHWDNKTVPIPPPSYPESRRCDGLIDIVFITDKDEKQPKTDEKTIKWRQI